MKNTAGDFFGWVGDSFTGGRGTDVAALLWTIVLGALAYYNPNDTFNNEQIIHLLMVTIVLGIGAIVLFVKNRLVKD